MPVFSQSALTVYGAGGDLKSQTKLTGYPPACFTWPGRQYTNLLRCSQARARNVLQLRARADTSPECRFGLGPRAIRLRRNPDAQSATEWETDQRRAGLFVIRSVLAIPLRRTPS